MPKKHLARAERVVHAGLVTRTALVEAGLDGDLGDRLVREGVWTRLAPSVYLAGAGAPTDGQLVEAAVAHAGPDAIMTGLVACRALDVPYAPAEPLVEVLIAPGTRVVSTAYVRVHQTARTPPTWRQGAVTYAMPLRAIVDGGRRLDHLRSVRALLLGAACAGFCSPKELAAEVEEGARRGSGLVRRAADDALAGAWSAPEAEAAQLVRGLVRAGLLPPFLLNPTLLLSGRRIGQPDGWIPGTGVGWQVESRRHHSSDDDFDSTLAVHDAYAAAGLTLLHVTPRRLRRLGPAWAHELRAAVEARARAGHTEPPGLEVRPIAPLQDASRARAPLPPRTAA